MNINEQELENRLQELKQQGKWISISLWPTGGNNFVDTPSDKPVHVCKINEDRLGLFNNISEDFYDRMVNEYDSRVKQRT